MARDIRTTTRSGDARLETAALLLAAVTALVAIARSDAVSRNVDPPAATPRLAAAAAPVPTPPTEAEADAARQASLRDMLLHD
ncbi:hypothetical protein LNAOJCKE_4396 [Methylorubrum aminovorans]|uniref:Uncharacterized protein n=1 Tax=Methylorubrum aminovorans TaxID=269069 RepID=A0ABQ4UIN4_9HYPH|nr:hypothetical protein [Methylorubrum aminovorans]GJE67169.1 hypothetical protein LNAOJCKE_4396 [Methylorubrum aminovorans]GMA75577.1 hypothetical protein GCM10025880_19940 [Methylorubrum aminovorans]